MFDSVLIIAPHTDDELGCSGFIKRITSANLCSKVCYMAFSTGHEKDVLTRECIDALQVIGVNSKPELFDFPVRDFPQNRQKILDTMIGRKNMYQPSLVLVPSSFDCHQDHKVIYEEAVRAFKDCSILGYELPWNNLSFSTQFYVKLTSEHLEEKIRSFKCYKSQIHRQYSDPECIRALAIMRGLQIRCRYAEAYEVIKWVM